MNTTEKETFLTLWHVEVCTTFSPRYMSSMDQLPRSGLDPHSASVSVQQSCLENKQMLLIRLVSIYDCLHYITKIFTVDWCVVADLLLIFKVMLVRDT